jgi:Family of unknown function (DUF6636)
MSARAIAAAAAAATLAAGGAVASAAAPVHHYSFFESPSRNIGCVILDGQARCDILVRSWTPPPRPASCPHVVDFGQGLEVSVSGRARFVCAGDTATNPHAPTLAYGQVTVTGELRCASATTGMTCRSTRTGHGFFISRQRYSIF